MRTAAMVPLNGGVPAHHISAFPILDPESSSSDDPGLTGTFTRDGHDRDFLASPLFMSKDFR